MRARKRARCCAWQVNELEVRAGIPLKQCAALAPCGSLRGLHADASEAQWEHPVLSSLFLPSYDVCLLVCVGGGGIEIQKGCELHYAGRNRFKSGRKNVARSASAQRASSKLKSSGDGSRGVHQGLGKHFLRCR